jgi:hypothetical protein
MKDVLGSIERPSFKRKFLTYIQLNDFGIIKIQLLD